MYSIPNDVNYNIIWLISLSNTSWNPIATLLPPTFPPTSFPSLTDVQDPDVIVNEHSLSLQFRFALPSQHNEFASIVAGIIFHLGQK